MADDTRSLDKLPVLNDDPLFWGSEEFDPSQDAFNHEAYARAIFDMLAENKPPLSIGLFGPWGIGKSTVISILFKLIKGSGDCGIKPLYFNAWKYSGDSFRRQFLIEIAKQVYEGRPDQGEKVLRLEQLNYTEVLREEEQKNLLENIKSLLSAPMRLRESGVARILLALAVIIIGAVFSAFDRSVYPFLSSAFAAIVLFFLRLKFEDVFVIQESPVYDPKLIFPEQFEAEFRKLIISSGPLGPLKPLVVIDDIDRCEPSTIRDILISIKTFIGQENCFFLVPCDDRSIVRIFADPNQQEGYKDELLRKYFNVGVRIAPLMATDLVDFARSVSKKTGVPPSVVQVAILGNYRDARKMKHFLNTFAVKYAIAKARQKSGFMPVDIDKNLASFAKAVLVEDLFPALFARMVEHPEIYDAIEQAALGRDAKSALDKFGLTNWEAKYPDLKSILQKTIDIRIEHIEVFLSLKTTNPEAKIPRGWELKNSIVEGDVAGFEEIIKQVPSNGARSALLELLDGLLRKESDTFLKNAITASLTCYFADSLVSADDKPGLAKITSFALIHGEGQKALQQNAPQALQCAADAQNLEDLLKKYESELDQSQDVPQKANETINALYKWAKKRAALSLILNRKFDSWIMGGKGLEILGKLELPTGMSGPDRFPSQALLEKVVASITTDANQQSHELNVLRKDILFKYWDGATAPLLGQKFLQILTQAQSDGSAFTPRAAFVIRSIVENPDCLEPGTSPQIWNTIRPLWNRMEKPEAKFEVHKVVLIFAMRALPSQQQDANAFASEIWRTFTNTQLKATLAYLDSFGGACRGLQTQLVQQELTLVQAELQNPTDRTLERLSLCYDNKALFPPDSVDSVLMKTLETSDPAFSRWRPTVSEYCKKLEPKFALAVADRCLNLLPGYNQPRRQQILELFGAALALVPDDSKPRLLQLYFGLCKHHDPNVRNPTVSVLGAARNAVDEQDFKLGLNTLVRDLCRMAPSEIAAYRSVLDACLQHSALFGEYEWRDLADLSKRSMQQSDTNLQDYGLVLVERMPTLTKEHDADLVHLLVAVARGTTQLQKERGDKVLRKAQEFDLSAAARESLQEYLNPPKRDPQSSRG